MDFHHRFENKIIHKNRFKFEQRKISNGIQLRTLITNSLRFDLVLSHFQDGNDRKYNVDVEGKKETNPSRRSRKFLIRVVQRTRVVEYGDRIRAVYDRI